MPILFHGIRGRGRFKQRDVDCARTRLLKVVLKDRCLEKGISHLIPLQARPTRLPLVSSVFPLVTALLL